MLAVKPKVLIFDLDDTLVDASGACERARQEAWVDGLNTKFSSARIEVKTRLPKNHVSAHNRILYLKRILEQDRCWTPTKNLEMMALYEKALAENFFKQWNALGRPQLFDKLRSKYKLGIITNENTRTQLIKLRAIDPEAKWFDFMMTSEEVGVEKPDLAVFKLAFELAGHAPDVCMMIGDSLENDIIPAQKQGLPTVLTTEFLRRPSENGGGAVPPTFTISKLEQILEVLE